MMWWNNGMGLWMIFGSLWMIIFWAAIIALIVWIVRKFTSQKGPSNNAIEIAKQRYARGEITKEQFEQIKKDLSS